MGERNSKFAWGQFRLWWLVIYGQALYKIQILDNGGIQYSKGYNRRWRPSHFCHSNTRQYCPDFKHHLKSSPLDDPTYFNQLNTGQVQYWKATVAAICITKWYRLGKLHRNLRGESARYWNARLLNDFSSEDAKGGYKNDFEHLLKVKWKFDGNQGDNSS